MTSPTPIHPGIPPDPLLPVFLGILRTWKQVTFMLADDLGGRCGITNLDTAVIILDAHNSDAAMRATILHEMLHLESADSPDEEVERRTAELLVPSHEALAAARTPGADIRQIAARLGVDVQLVRARIRSIPTQSETADGVG